MTEHDAPIEYDTITEGDENTTRTTKIPRMPDSKDSQETNLPENVKKDMVFAANGEPLTKRYVKSPTLQSSQEEDEDLNK